MITPEKCDKTEAAGGIAKWKQLKTFRIGAFQDGSARQTDPAVLKGRVPVLYGRTTQGNLPNNFANNKKCQGWNFLLAVICLK